MSTLADELLNDFGDSGSEGEEGQQNGFLKDGPSPPAINGQAQAPDGSMVLDDDEEEADEEDEEMDNPSAGGGAAAADVEDEEEAKAKVEKMQLGGVNDVRSVAGLMKTLEPILQVCSVLRCIPPSRLCDCLDQCLHLLWNIALTLFFPVASRESHIIRLYRRGSRLRLWARSKIILSTTSSLNPTRSRPPSITKSYWCTSLFATITRHASQSSRL